MSDRPYSFGRRVRECGNAAALLALEDECHKGPAFRALDVLLGELLVRSLQGQRILALHPAVLGPEVTVDGLDAAQRTFVDETFAVEKQHARGALFLPENPRLNGGVANLAAAFLEVPRFPCVFSLEETGRVRLAGSPDSVFLWCVLEPLFAAVYRPLLVRGPQPLAGTPDEQHRIWEEMGLFYQELGFSVTADLEPMRYGSGWGRLRAEGQLEIKRRLLSALARQTRPDTAARYRAMAVRRLVAQYYERAGGGLVTRKRALSKPFEPLLCGLFGGDWLAFLRYLGEVPHPDEQIVQGLPEPRLYVHGASRVEEVAAKSGMPPEEVARIVGAFWSGQGAKSPIEERVDALRAYWHAFDGIHARQQPGMEPLWGLVQESTAIYARDLPDGPYRHGLYTRLLPSGLLDEIDRLWATMMLPKWPESIVSAAHPHAILADTFGPALKFWHGCALTAWFLCEGPTSRTDLPGLPHYHLRELAQLENMGTAISGDLFAELILAGEKLGPAQPIYEAATAGALDVLSLGIQFGRGTRREGFAMLRDIISRHRASWGKQYLESYLRARWETELRDASREYHLLQSTKGRPPTASQFAKTATSAVNHWFGGDLSGLYRAIGVKSPITPAHRERIPIDRVAFVRAVAEALQGRLVGAAHFGEVAPWYLQLEEVLGRPPELKEFGVSKLGWLGQEQTQDPEAIWRIYQAAVETIKAGFLMSDA